MEGSNCGVLDAFIREESRAGRVRADVGLLDPALQGATPIPRQVSTFSLLFENNSFCCYLLHKEL